MSSLFITYCPSVKTPLKWMLISMGMAIFNGVLDFCRGLGQRGFQILLACGFEKGRIQYEDFDQVLNYYFECSLIRDSGENPYK
jgi:hypothetical protein